MVGLNSLVRQFGLRFQCNGIKQLAYSIRHASCWGKEHTVFLTSGEETKLQHFLSRTLLGTHHVRGKERTVYLTSG